MRPFQVEWLDSAKAQVRRLDRQIVRRILVSVEHFAQSEIGDVMALKGDLAGAFRLRVGDYRILFRLQAGTMVIFAVRHRSKAYR